MNFPPGPTTDDFLDSLLTWMESRRDIERMSYNYDGRIIATTREVKCRADVVDALEYIIDKRVNEAISKEALCG